LKKALNQKKKTKGWKERKAGPNNLSIRKLRPGSGTSTNSKKTEDDRLGGLCNSWQLFTGYRRTEKGKRPEKVNNGALARWV